MFFLFTTLATNLNQVKSVWLQSSFSRIEFFGASRAYNIKYASVEFVEQRGGLKIATRSDQAASPNASVSNIHILATDRGASIAAFCALTNLETPIAQPEAKSIMRNAFRFKRRLFYPKFELAFHICKPELNIEHSAGSEMSELKSFFIATCRFFRQIGILNFAANLPTRSVITTMS